MINKRLSTPHYDTVIQRKGAADVYQKTSKLTEIL
jgi:hypothetical protein